MSRSRFVEEMSRSPHAEEASLPQKMSEEERTPSHPDLSEILSRLEETLVKLMSARQEHEKATSEEDVAQVMFENPLTLHYPDQKHDSAQKMSAHYRPGVGQSLHSKKITAERISAQRERASAAWRARVEETLPQENTQPPPAEELSGLADLLFLLIEAQLGNDGNVDTNPTQADDEGRESAIAQRRIIRFE